MAAWIEAPNVWQNGVHARGLAVGGASTFVLALLMFEGLERWDRRRHTRKSGPPPPLPPGVPGSLQPDRVDGTNAKPDN